MGDFGFDPVGGYVSSYVQGDAARKAQHSAETALYTGREAGVKALDEGYAGAEAEYSLLDGILNDSYGQGISTIKGSFEQSAAAVQSGYNSARDEVVVGYDEAGKAIYGSYGKAREEYDPWKKTGESAQNVMADLNGLNGPERQKAAYERLQFDPGYQSRVDAADKALKRSALAAGNIFSGNYAHALQKQSGELASDEYTNYYNRLMGISDRGLSAADSRAGLFAAEGSTLADLYAGKGRILAGLDTDEGATMSNLYSNYGTNVANLQTGLGAARSSALQNKATLAANKGTATANLYAGAGSELAKYGYLGEMNIGAAKAQAASVAGSTAQAGVNSYTGVVSALYGGGGALQKQKTNTTAQQDPDDGS